MGVDKLYKFFNTNFPDLFYTISILDIQGNPCIIDGMQHIYSQLIYLRSREKEVYTKNNKNISHICGLINSLTYYLKNGIIPIFIFDGKMPDFKKNKIEERKKKLKENISKLKELENKKNISNEYINIMTTNMINFMVINNHTPKIETENINNDEYIISDSSLSKIINLDEEKKKIDNLQEEFKKIYKKSIIMKDYYIKDWIEILDLLGLPVIRAEGEADPICAYIHKNNPYIYGIISDDSDMLIFGSPKIMRKSVNQQFTIIELDKILNKIKLLLFSIYNFSISFNLDNLIDFSILLGTDYGTIELLKTCNDPLEILKYYVDNDKNYKNIININELEKFKLIKNYYLSEDFNNNYDNYLTNPEWKKPRLMELKKRLLELDVDEEYIDNNNEYFNFCYNKIKNNLTDKNYKIKQNNNLKINL